MKTLSAYLIMFAVLLYLVVCYIFYFFYDTKRDASGFRFSYFPALFWGFITFCLFWVFLIRGRRL